jgi:uncharacterized protein YdiU (UPF0061 family)
METHTNHSQPDIKLAFDNSYARLPEQFYSRLPPEPVTKPGLIRVNHALARQLGIEPGWLESEAGVAVMAGNTIPDGADPLATVYAGHQFGGWNPQLGDGRAILLGEIIATDGERFDIQLKGSGRTPYSRGGDGRAPLGPVLREYIISEAMAVLGVPTTRALAAVSTGQQVFREMPLPGAVLARVARSHIRIGTLQYFASREDIKALKMLVDHVIERHYPQSAEAENPALAMLEEVIAAQAALIARWQSLGFIHGVMNTDNMLLSGETIDYGPCAFMDSFDPAAVFSSIDRGGRYAYGNQPTITHWNLSCLAGTLLPLLDDDQKASRELAQGALDGFPDQFLAAYHRSMNAKLGLNEFEDDDETLVRDLLKLMTDEKTDFTLTFRHLADLAGPDENPPAAVGTLIELPGSFETWLQRWRKRLSGEPRDSATRQTGMFKANPAFIPRNHLVEEAIDAATNRSDFEPFHTLVDVLSQPFQFDPGHERHALPPRADQIVKQTFCGT